MHMTRPSHHHSRTLRDTYSESDDVGVQDFVLLEDFTNPAAFVKNLRDRFRRNLIYTYISNVLVSVNPYQELKIYSPDFINLYQNVNLYELPPHLYAISDQAFRSMKEELLDQCILISGESGAGKTEASKKILTFLAASSSHTHHAETVKDRLLQSNPILEAFGNAKTIRNNNSSRFGKYMEVQFDFKGEPLGGQLNHYLLEKSRVVCQADGEQNFHIFYFLLKCGDSALLRSLELVNDPMIYNYTRQGGQPLPVSPSDYQEVIVAFSHMGFQPAEINNLLHILAGILHLGEVDFADLGKDHCELTPKASEVVQRVEGLLSVPPSSLKEALTHLTVVARGQQIKSNINRDKALYARDALAKSLYERMFGWLVARINTSLSTEYHGRKTLMGLLDIYGFEVMNVNSFEQFCINYCNEKLQQVFIELTLKSEQEEYKKEGIQWEEIPFFNNKIICDMVEMKHAGIIAVLDEECLRPGNVSDATFLDRLNAQFKMHKHYLSHLGASYSQRKNLGRYEFQIAHYAGNVTYCVEGFIDKNNDLLLRDLKEAMCKSENTIVGALYTKAELETQRRPPTAGSQFRTSLNALVDVLMVKVPSYVRCVKPNHAQKHDVFDDELVTHQVIYLGLMENLRVRRAGFAYRRVYPYFLKRYKSLSPATWPSYNGPPKEGTRELMQYLKIDPSEYRLGETKIFIRNSRTLFKLEALFNDRRHALATMIAAKFKAHVGRKKYLALKSASVTMQKYTRRYLAQNELKRTRKAYWVVFRAILRWRWRRKRAKAVIKKFVRGFVTRHQPRCRDNAVFLDFVRVRWLLTLRKHLPKRVLDRSWTPFTPPYLASASALLRKYHKLNQARGYRLSLSAERRDQLSKKLAASNLFAGRKENYPQSVGVPFVTDHMEPVSFAQNPHRPVFIKYLSKHHPQEANQIRYVVDVLKFDRSSYQQRPRVLVATSLALYILYPDSFKISFRMSFASLVKISVSNKSDGFFVIHTPLEDKRDKGDFMLQTAHIIECITMVGLAGHVLDKIHITDAITHNMRNGRSGSIVFKEGNDEIYGRNKRAHSLEVASPRSSVPSDYMAYRSKPPLRPFAEVLEVTYGDNNDFPIPAPRLSDKNEEVIYGDLSSIYDTSYAPSPNRPSRPKSEKTYGYEDDGDDFYGYNNRPKPSPAKVSDPRGNQMQARPPTTGPISKNVKSPLTGPPRPTTNTSNGFGNDRSGGQEVYGYNNRPSSSPSKPVTASPSSDFYGVKSGQPKAKIVLQNDASLYEATEDDFGFDSKPLPPRGSRQTPPRPVEFYPQDDTYEVVDEGVRNGIKNRPSNNQKVIQASSFEEGDSFYEAVPDTSKPRPSLSRPTATPTTPTPTPPHGFKSSPQKLVLNGASRGSHYTTDGDDEDMYEPPPEFRTNVIKSPQQAHPMSPLHSQQQFTFGQEYDEDESYEIPTPVSPPKPKLVVKASEQSLYANDDDV